MHIHAYWIQWKDGTIWKELRHELLSIYPFGPSHSDHAGWYLQKLSFPGSDLRIRLYYAGLPVAV